MGTTRKAYSEKFREQMVRLVRSGRTPEDLGREFEPSAQSIRNWVSQSELDDGTRSDGLTTDERAELAKLRRENARRRKSERFCQKPRPGSLRRRTRNRTDLHVRESASGRVLDTHDVPRAGSLSERLLRMAIARDVDEGKRRSKAAAKGKSNPRAIPREPLVRRVLFRWDELRIPHNLPQVTVRIGEVPCVPSPESLMRRTNDRCTSCGSSSHDGIHLGSGCYVVPDRELGCAPSGDEHTGVVPYAGTRPQR